MLPCACQINNKNSNGNQCANEVNLYPFVAMIYHFSIIYFKVWIYLLVFIHFIFFLQCFDAVGWAAGRASGL